MILHIRGDKVTMVYDEHLDLSSLGKTSIKRASRVEPGPDNKWSADLKLSGGPVLGEFARRSEALAAEHNWLEEHLSMLTGEEHGE